MDVEIRNEKSCIAFNDSLAAIAKTLLALKIAGFESNESLRQKLD